MMDIPLFPLNTVLFPGIPFQLHIFEERYKQMTTRCLDSGQPFGVVLIKKGQEALGPLAEPHPVGCTAHIAEAQRLSEGRFNLTVVGGERFRILSLSYDQPYLVGQVALQPFEELDPDALRLAGDRLRPMVARYLDILRQASDASFEAPGLPDQPLELGYLAAYILQTPLHRKQDLLSEDRALAFLAGLNGLYPGEIALLQTILSRGEAEAQSVGAFSFN